MLDIAATISSVDVLQKKEPFIPLREVNAVDVYKLFLTNGSPRCSRTDSIIRYTERKNK